MWGLWLVVSNTEVKQHQQQHVGWPVADLKVVQKSSSFDGGQQADFCSVCFHCKAQLAIHSWDHMFEGSTHTPSGNTRRGKKTKTGSCRCGPRNQTSLTVKG